MAQVVLLRIQDKISAYILLLLVDLIENIIVKAKYLQKVWVVEFELL
jgi:hypothetical protein